jgi:hypothetical protein
LRRNEGENLSPQQTHTLQKTNGNQGREQIAGATGEDFSKQAHLREGGERRAEALTGEDGDPQTIDTVEEIGSAIEALLVILTYHRHHQGGEV